MAGQLRALNLTWPGAQWRWSTPAASGYVPRFVRVDAARVEAQWKEVEDRLPAALDELRLGGPAGPGSPTEDAVIACLAMHWARSKAVRDASDRIYQEQRQLSMDRLARQPGVLDRVHLAATGVRAVDQETRRLANERLHTGPPEIVSGAHFAGRVIDYYEEALDWYGRQHLQIYDIPADGPDLIISDAPVLTPDRAGTGLSPLSGVPLRKARSVAMPLGPRLAVSLNPVAERVTVTGEQAEELNAMQRRAAAESLYRKPIADDGPAPGLKTAR